jgi:tripartite-type tricarboxylate transporter receptor subunit TctC
MAGTSIPHVPYRGSPPALADVVAGHVPLSFTALTPALDLIRSGKLKAIAVGTPQRSPALPEIPTVGETLEGFQVSVWTGLATTKGTPTEVIERLNKSLNEFMTSTAMTARNRDLGVTIFADNTVQNFSRFVTDEVAHWAKVIKAGNIKPE